MSLYDRAVMYDRAGPIERDYRRPVKSHIHDDRFIGRQTINCNQPAEDRFEVFATSVPNGGGGRINFAFIVSILLTIAFIVLVWDLYRDGSSTYLRRAVQNAQTRNIQLPSLTTPV